MAGLAVLVARPVPGLPSYPVGGGCAQACRSAGTAFQGRKRSRSGPASGLPPLRPQASRQAVR